MPHIDSTNFGSVTVDGKKYHQVLIVGDDIFERDYERLKKEFDTSHVIPDWEVEKLLENQPEVIVVATGQDGALKVSDETRKKLAANGARVVSEATPKAVEVYNRYTKENKSVNALIHTTC